MRVLTFLALLPFAACAASDRPTEQAALADVPGQAIGDPISCLRASDVDNVEAVNDYVAFVHMNGKRTYRTDFPNGCRGLKRDSFAHRSTINQYCRGDIITLFDPASGATYGSCVFGMFTPYELPKAAPES